MGGHVEALESGVFRSDIPCHFKMVMYLYDPPFCCLIYLLIYLIHLWKESLFLIDKIGKIMWMVFLELKHTTTLYVCELCICTE